MCSSDIGSGSDWSGRRDLTPRPSPWQGDALPLSYSRWVLFEYIGRGCGGQRNAGPNWLSFGTVLAAIGRRVVHRNSLLIQPARTYSVSQQELNQGWRCKLIGV